MYRPAILGLVELPDALDFARTNRWSVLTTIRGNGHRAYGMLSLPGRSGTVQE